MSTADTLVTKIVVLATIAGLGSAAAFLVVACGGGSASSGGASPTLAWRALPPAPIRVDAYLSSAWTGKKLIISGVRSGPDGTFIDSTNVAAEYDPSTRTWRRLTPGPEMENYCRRDVAWTGSEMLLWGCKQAAFDPKNNSWRMLPKAPTGEGIVAWTGHELIGWGGGCCGDAWDGGSAYDPAASTWRTLARTPLAPSQGAAGTWTGRELVLFVNGINPASGRPWPARFARAAAYDPATDTWRRITPSPATGGAAVWDGREVLLVGAGAEGRSALAFDPATNHWRRLSTPPSSLPTAHAFWTGHRLLVWGGAESPRAVAYDPEIDRWSTLPRAPVLGPEQTVVWTGRQLIVWSSVAGAALTLG